MTGESHPHHGDGHHHHHHHHRPAMKVRGGAVRPEQPKASLLTLSLGARLGAAALLAVVLWSMIGWAIQ